MHNYNGFDAGANVIFGIIWLLVIGFILLVALAAFIFHIVMIIDCVKRDFKDRTVWLVVLIAGFFVGFGWLAAIIYYYTVKSKNVGTTHTASTGNMSPRV